MTSETNNTDLAKKKRVKIHETTLENDMRYLGPLSGRHFKILGWLCIVIAQSALFVKLGGRIDPVYAAQSASWLKVLQTIADFSLPFLLIASFSQLLNAENGYIKQILVNGAAMAGLCALYYLLFFRYLVGGFKAILDPPSEALPTVHGLLSPFMPYGFFCFNIFVDLFLCALTMFFLNYRPRRVFTGKSRILFRLLALLPIAYEVGCMLLKVRSARGQIQIPEWIYPLLTVKPPMTFVLFVALALFVKTRELRFRRHGKTHEEYQAFLKTNRNSWNFSVFLAIMLVIVSLLDFVVAISFSLNEVVRDIAPAVEVTAQATSGPVRATPKPARRTAQPTQEVPSATQDPAEAARQEAEAAAAHEAQIEASITMGMRTADAVGFGGSISLFFLAPLVLLFSYTRKSKNPMLDLLIPAAGIVLIVFMYLEGSHQLLVNLPIQKFSLQEFQNTTEMYKIMLQ